MTPEKWHELQVIGAHIGGGWAMDTLNLASCEAACARHGLARNGRCADARLAVWFALFDGEISPSEIEADEMSADTMAFYRNMRAISARQTMEKVQALWWRDRWNEWLWAIKEGVCTIDEVFDRRVEFPNGKFELSWI